MKLNPSLSQRQQLTLSPRLYQSLKILRLSAAELQDAVQKELDENPTLELPEPADIQIDDPGRELWEQYEQVHREETAARGKSAPMPLNPTELTASPVTLADHLTLQLELIDGLSDRGQRLGRALIGSLDADGYLRDSLETLAESTRCPAAEAERVLEVVQGFDPAGIAARSLEECLVLQLRQLGAGRVALAIAESWLPQVAGSDFAAIARGLKVPAARVHRAVTLIRDLNPAPGSLFDTSPPAGAVIPDVYVTLEQGHLQVLANRDALPTLQVSRLYEQMAAATESSDPAAAAYVKKKLRDARRLIRDIEQRRVTVAKVATAIAEAQSGFFESGPAALRPLTLEDIARRLDVHASTISRAILGKFMSTPYGIFELRYFFGAGYSSSGGDMAATAVKKRLAELIAAEDRRRPLSDQKLAELLKQEQISISRRTVAKYREESGVPPSWQRREEAAV